MDLRSAEDAALEARLLILKEERSRNLAARRGYHKAFMAVAKQANVISTELAARSSKGVPTPRVKDDMVSYNLARVAACRFALPPGDWFVRSAFSGVAEESIFAMYYAQRLPEIGTLAESFGARVDSKRRIVFCDNVLISLELMARGAQFRSLRCSYKGRPGRRTRTGISRTLRDTYVSCYIDRTDSNLRNETHDAKETRHREQQGGNQDDAERS